MKNQTMLSFSTKHFLMETIQTKNLTTAVYFELLCKNMHCLVLAQGII
jgi:hypothetical protein